MAQLKFVFNEAKAIEALALIAKKHAGFTPLFVSKIFFYAEKWHLNRYGRPIIADTYIAMPRGPVPSNIKNFIDENWDWVEKPDQFENAIKISCPQGMPRQLMPGERGPDLRVLSESEIECLSEAVCFCENKTVGELSQLTHFEKSWMNADTNRAMNYLDFIDDDNPHKEEIIQIAQENAVHGI